MDANKPATRTILVADADPAFRSFLSGLLRPRNLEVVAARGIWDVWPLVDTHDVALFIVDADVPDEGGMALVAEIRKRGITTPILYVATKWQGADNHARLTNSLGVQRVLHKPFSAYQFIMEVEGTLAAPIATMTLPLPTAVGPQDSVPRRLVSEPMMAAIDHTPPSSSGMPQLIVIGKDDTLRTALEGAGENGSVSLVFKNDAEEAAHLLNRQHLDGALVLLDHEDPDAGFAEATELLCSDVGKAFPIGFVSDRSDIDLRVNAIHAGGVVHLTPPFRPQDLQQAATAMSHLRQERGVRIVVVAEAARGAEVSAVLGRADMQVVAVSDAYRLIDHLGATTPDIILFDLDLRGVSGLDVCKLLRASPSWRALALMLISTHGSSEARIAAFDAGADDFLVKPLSEEELVARVEARARRHRAVRESAGKDPITGLLHRHVFVDRARAMLAAARRTAAAVAFCVLRIDDLVTIREQHDQLTSERAVLEVGRLLADLLREYDLRARWSENELMLALVDVDASTADQLFARLSVRLKNLELRDAHGHPVPLKFSVGVAAHPDDAQSIPTLVRIARKRLALIAATAQV